MRVLLVENEKETLSALAKALRASGHSVHIARDGIAALYYGAMIRHEAMILDEQLPSRGGFEVLWELRRRGVDSRILMLLEPGTPEAHAAALEYGADAFVSKPVKPEEVVSRLSSLLRPVRHRHHRKLTVQDLRIDTRGQRVWRAGERLSLTPEEYLLLELLAVNAGRVVDAAEIAETLGAATLDSVHTVEAYVQRLRRKLERNGATPVIEVRDGAGYALALEPAAA